MANEVVVTGFAELNKMLRQLKTSTKKIMRRAMRKAMRPVHADAKSRAPREGGALRQSIKLRAGKFNRKRIIMRVTTGDRTLRSDRWYGQFQELGWKPGRRPSNSNNTAVEGDHFMRDAANNNKQQVRTILIREVGDELESEMRRGL